MATSTWRVGQTVEVQSRTWAGINKPGGCAKITKIHFTDDGENVESLDVKYVLGGGEKEIDPAIVSPFETLERGGRKRRGREFLMEQANKVVKKLKEAKAQDKKDMPPPGNRKRTKPQTTRNDQSTSPSTPVTPEHPSAVRSKASRAVTKSVPSLVFADSLVEVSPLPLDRAVKEQKKASVVRRGLFGTSQDTNKKKKKQAKLTDVGHTVSKVAASAAAAASKIKPKARPALERSSAPGKENQQQRGATKKVDSRQSKSAVPKKSAQVKGTQKPLKDVFDYELRKAREFLDEVCRAPCPEPETSSDEDVDATKSRIQTFSPPDEDKKPSASSSKREEFLALFRSLRPRFDDEDGAMDESKFLALTIQRSKDTLTKPEVQQQLQLLCEDGKLMKSDGILYIID